jgi:hypothetical protein
MYTHSTWGSTVNFHMQDCRTILTDVASYQQALDKMLLRKNYCISGLLMDQTIRSFAPIHFIFNQVYHNAPDIILFVVLLHQSSVLFQVACYVLTNFNVGKYKNYVLTHVCTSPCWNLSEVNRKLHFIVFESVLCFSPASRKTLIHMYVSKFSLPLTFYPIISKYFILQLGDILLEGNLHWIIPTCIWWLIFIRAAFYM